jgi:hypothetical protein
MVRLKNESPMRTRPKRMCNATAKERPFIGGNINKNSKKASHIIRYKVAQIFISVLLYKGESIVVFKYLFVGGALPNLSDNDVVPKEENPHQNPKGYIPIVP